MRLCHNPVPSNSIFIPGSGHCLTPLLAPEKPPPTSCRGGVQGPPVSNVVPQRLPRALPIPSSPRRFSFLPARGLLLVRPLVAPSSVAWPGSSPWWPQARHSAGLQMAAQSGAASPATPPDVHAGLADPSLCSDFPKACRIQMWVGISLGMLQAAVVFPFLCWGIS